jgi:hypothetical protein
MKSIAYEILCKTDYQEAEFGLFRFAACGSSEERRAYDALRQWLLQNPSIRSVQYGGRVLADTHRLFKFTAVTVRGEALSLTVEERYL